jgi:hypothetical protein
MGENPTPPFDEAAFRRLSLYMTVPNPSSVDFEQLIGPTPPDAEPSKEKHRVNERLANFSTKDNFAWKEISSRLGQKITFHELLSIARVLAAHADIWLDRDARRRKSVLIKWFDENWSDLAPYLNDVVLEDAHPPDHNA